MRKINDLRAGAYNKKNKVVIWGNIEDDTSFVFDVTRGSIPFSSREKHFLSFVPDVLEHTLPVGGLPEAQQIQRLSGRMVLGTAIVAKYLHNKKGAGFWPPSFLLSMLQGLASQNYESAAATSGFIIVPKREELHRKEITETYDIRFFGDPIRLREGFFDDPISYRYVDGRNAFYLVDRLTNVFGIARIRHPLNYSLSDRIFGNHLRPMLNTLHGRCWAVFVGNQRDIQIVTRSGPELRWNRSFWQFVHIPTIQSLICSYGISEDVSNLLVRLLFCLSVMRTGSLILIPGGDGRPEYASSIDSSKLQSEIFGTIRGKNASEFVDGAGLFGLFGSDGVVVLLADGTIEQAGKIVTLGVSDQQFSGGGRTQAAISCSKFGLAIKVSEDGPISFFSDEKLLFKTNG